MMKNKGMKGFTFLELMIVICIAGILSGFAYLGHDLIQHEKVSSLSRELLADIQTARMNAITREGKGFGIRFESPTTYVLFQFNDCNNDYNYDSNTCEGGSAEESNVVRKTIASPVVLQKSTQANDVENEIIIFDKFGHPRQKNWGLGMMTILVKLESDPSFVKCVTISMNRVREALWNGFACI